MTEIVDFPIKNGGSFHSFLLNYQRVNTYSTPKKNPNHPHYTILKPRLVPLDARMHNSYASPTPQRSCVRTFFWARKRWEFTTEKWGKLGKLGQRMEHIWFLATNIGF